MDSYLLGMYRYILHKSMGGMCRILEKKIDGRQKENKFLRTRTTGIHSDPISLAFLIIYI